MKVHKQQLLKETKELKDARDDLRRSNNDLESRLEQANERTEDVKRREREVNDQIARLRQRLTEKERQCETLRREAERVIDIHSQLEAKVDRQAPVMKPAQIQTEKTEDQILLEQHNDALGRDLEAIKEEFGELVAANENLQRDNQEFQARIVSRESEILRMQELFSQLEQDLTKERAAVKALLDKDRLRKERKSKRKLEKALKNNQSSLELRTKDH